MVFTNVMTGDYFLEVQLSNNGGGGMQLKCDPRPPTI